ncbi:MAG: FAD-dependent thymidylate synthase [Trueperaceae bacterium]
MARNSSPAADAMLDSPIRVLDHGFVRLVDYLGNDARIVQAARVSYGEGTKTVREDAALIDFLLRNRHTSPFEMVELTLHIKAPIFVARQAMRHRTASANEVSGRYSVLPDEFYLPTPEQVRAQGKRSRQVGEGPVEPAAAQYASEAFDTALRRSYQTYNELLEAGVAREMAREVLPVGLYTEFYWKQDLHNLFHFLRLRMDWHAQFEIRAYGDAIARCVQAVAPMAYQAFEEHILQGRSLARGELDLVREAIDMDKLLAGLAASGMRRSRQREFMDKLGLELPPAKEDANRDAEPGTGAGRPEERS